MAMLGTACSRDNARKYGSAPGEGGGRSGAANPPATSAATTDMKMSAADHEFVQKAAKGNESEVEMAKMAQDKAQTADVKDYAKQLEQDHSDALDDLRRMASKANMTLDTTPPAEKASMTHKLDANAKNFDHEYIRMMIDDHQKDIADFERQQTTATGELKAFIEKTLPVMREHLQKAENLMETMGKTGDTKGKK